MPGTLAVARLGLRNERICFASTAAAIPGTAQCERSEVVRCRPTAIPLTEGATDGMEAA